MPAAAVRFGDQPGDGRDPRAALEGRMSAEGELLWIGGLLQRQS